MRGRLPVAVLLMAVWALLAVSCGGGELTKEEYGSELRSTMQELQEAYGSAGDALQIESAPTGGGGDAKKAPATLGDIVADLKATQIALRDAGNRLSEIDPPAAVTADHEQLVSGVREMADDVDLLIDAQELAVEDPKRAAALARQFAGSESFDRVQQAAQRISEAGIDAGL